MDSFLQTLKAGVDNYVEVDYPGTDKKIRIHALSDLEEQSAEFAAERIFRDDNITVGMHNVTEFELEKTTQKLWRACKTVDGERLVPTDVGFKSLITRSERDILVDHYNQLLEKCNPNPDTMTDKQFSVLLDEVKKKPVETIGNISNLQTLRRLATCLARVQWNSPTDSGPTSSE